MPRPCSSTNSVGCRRGCYSVVVQEPGRTATWLAQLAYDWLFVKTGMVDWMTNMTTSRRPGHGARWTFAISPPRVSPRCRTTAWPRCTVLTFVVRLVILVMTIPLFLMAAFTGLVDGLVRRDLRKFGAGRESSYLYHKARGSISGRPLDALPGNPHQHQSPAHPVALRRAARRSGMHHSIHLQKYL